MRNSNDRPVAKLLPYKFLHQPIRLPIHIARRLLQKQHLASRPFLPRHRSREAEQLLLAPARAAAQPCRRRSRRARGACPTGGLLLGQR